MNLKEGTRRLALLLGVAGAIAGGFTSYLELQTVLSQRAAHERFEHVAQSDVVQQERKTLQAQPNDWQEVNLDPRTAEPIQINPQTGERIPQNRSDKSEVRPPAPSPDFLANATPVSTSLNRDGIETINWSHDYGVASIQTEDGQTLYPTAAPSAWEYLLIALFPILGFFVPWGAVRAIGWVGAGFVGSSR